MILAALALGHAALTVTTASLLAIGAVLLVAGVAIASAYATINTMADQAAPGGNSHRGVRLAFHRGRQRDLGGYSSRRSAGPNRRGRRRVRARWPGRSPGRGHHQAAVTPSAAGM